MNDNDEDLAAYEKAVAEEAAKYEVWLKTGGEELLLNRSFSESHDTVGPAHDPYGRTIITAKIGATKVTLVRCALAGTYVKVCDEIEDWRGPAAEQHFEELVGVPLWIIEHKLRLIDEAYERDPMGHLSDYE